MRIKRRCGFKLGNGKMAQAMLVDNGGIEALLLKIVDDDVDKTVIRLDHDGIVWHVTDSGNRMIGKIHGQTVLSGISSGALFWAQVAKTVAVVLDWMA